MRNKIINFIYISELFSMLATIAEENTKLFRFFAMCRLLIWFKPK